LPGLALVLLAPATLLAQDPAGQPNRAGGPDFAAVRESIRARLVSQTVPSLAVAVARDGKILWEAGFGWADREKRTPATEHTMYSLASVSKPITTTGLLVLKQRGLVDLDRPVNDYLGEAKLKAWVGDARAATVRRVANHSAGLPTHARRFYEDEPYRRPPMDETILRYGNLVRPPGEQFDYSNLGYGILDYVIARRSGKSYADFMREEVFLPLGMTRASVNIGPGLAPYVAACYGADGVPIPLSDTDHRGASAVYCSAHDLVRFGLFHLRCRLRDQKAILSDDNLEAAKAPSRDPVPREFGYGLGWFFTESRGYRKVGAQGGDSGTSAVLSLIPSEKIAVAVVCNTGSDLPGLVENEILASLLPEPGKEPARPQVEKHRAGRKDPTPAPEPTALAGEGRGHVHTYQGDVSLTLWFRESGDVHVQLGGQLKTLLNRVERQGDSLAGMMTGDVGTEDANRRPYDLYLELKRRGDRLTGDVFTVPRSARRDGGLLSYWVELKKR
jgi:CubicO group peptidase (beta-lactamase class C family)